MRLQDSIVVAQGGMSAAGAALELVARNVSATSMFQTRKYLDTVWSSAHEPPSMMTRRLHESAAYDTLLEATARASYDSTMSLGLQASASYLGSADGATGIAAGLSDLESAVRVFASAPSSPIAAGDVILKAKNQAQLIRQAAVDLAAQKEVIDQQISDAIAQCNMLLTRFASVCRAARAATNGSEVTGLGDERDSVAGAIAEYIPIRLTEKRGGTPSLEGPSGIPLSDDAGSESRAMLSVNPGHDGTIAIKIDGVALDKFIGAPAGAGSLAALVELRNDIIPRIETQIDALAEGLEQAFGEDNRIGAGPLLPGLFMSSASTLSSGRGAAQRFVVNDRVDPDASGSPFLLRDGGANPDGNMDYFYNKNDDAGYNDRLYEILDKLDAPIVLDQQLGLGNALSAVELSTAIVAKGHIASTQAAHVAKASGDTQANTEAVWKSRTHASMDSEMALMLQLERSYQAAATVLSTVDKIFGYLFEATR